MAWSVGAYAIAVLLVTAFHEPWRDEADVWLMVRDNDPRSLYSLLRHSGTPGLWHLLLMPWAKAGVPYAAESLLHNAIAIGAAAVVLACAPFPKWVRLLLVFSFYPGFEYSVVARSYGLTMLMLFGLAALDGQRLRRPVVFGGLIGLLANTNAHGFLLGCVAAVFFGLDVMRRRALDGRLLGLAVAGLGIVLAFLQILPPEDGQARAIVEADRMARLVGVLDRSFVPVGMLTAAWATPVGVAVNALALTGAWCLLDGRTRLFAAASMLALIGFFVFVYYAGHRHAGLLFLVLTVAVWITRNRSRATGPSHPPGPRRQRVTSWAKRVCLGSLVSSCAVTAIVYWQEVTSPYSGARAAAEFLRREGLTHRTVAGYPDALASAVLPFLPEARMWYAGIEDYGTHMNWDARYIANTTVPFELALMRMEAAFPNRPDFVVLLGEQRLMSPELRGYRWLGSFPGPPMFPGWLPRFGAVDEEFHLYEPLPVPQVDLFCFWGETLRRLGSFDDSIEVLEAASRVDSTSLRARRELGMSLLAAGQRERAVLLFDEVQQRTAPPETRIIELLSLGSVLRDAGARDAARRFGEIALQLASSAQEEQWARAFLESTGSGP